jgi:hypothetical protein
MLYGRPYVKPLSGANLHAACGPAQGRQCCRWTLQGCVRDTHTHTRARAHTRAHTHARAHTRARTHTHTHTGAPPCKLRHIYPSQQCTSKSRGVQYHDIHTHTHTHIQPSLPDAPCVPPTHSCVAWREVCAQVNRVACKGGVRMYISRARLTHGHPGFRNRSRTPSLTGMSSL